MKYKLNGLDRIFIPGMLPQAGSRLEQIVVREILDIIEFKSSEFEEFNLVQHSDGKLTWDVEKIKNEKEFDLKKPHTELLKEAVSKLDSEKGITQRTLNTCLKIEKMRG